MSNPFASRGDLSHGSREWCERFLRGFAPISHGIFETPLPGQRLTASSRAGGRNENGQRLGWQINSIVGQPNLEIGCQ